MEPEQDTDRLARTRRRLKNMLDAVVTFVYPDGCLACHADTPLGRHLCPECDATIRCAQQNQCPRCAAPLGPYQTVGDDCPECHGRRYAFKRALACGPYESPLGALVRAYKYERRVFLADSLAEKMSHHLVSQDVTADLVVPVPMHPLSVLRRGLDHAGLLAAKVARRIDRPCLTHLLRKRRLGPRMVGLGFRARTRLAREAYALRPDPHLKGRSVLLVDDVMTTGATASECARLLRDVGVSTVLVLVVARQARSVVL